MGYAISRWEAVYDYFALVFLLGKSPACQHFLWLCKTKQEHCLAILSANVESPGSLYCSYGKFWVDHIALSIFYSFLVTVIQLTRSSVNSEFWGIVIHQSGQGKWLALTVGRGSRVRLWNLKPTINDLLPLPVGRLKDLEFPQCYNQLGLGAQHTSLSGTFHIQSTIHMHCVRREFIFLHWHAEEANLGWLWRDNLLDGAE